MNFDLTQPAQLSGALAPDLILMGGAMLLLLWAGWKRETNQHQRSVGILSIALCVITMIAVGYYAYEGYTAGNGVIAVDNFRWAADEIFLIATIGTIAMSLDYNEREGITAGETHVLLLLATSGMMILAAARDLIIVFLGIELMSIAIYVLVGMNRRRERSAEGAIKYFLLGAFSTAFLLYGIALVYGATGATNFVAIRSSITRFGLAQNGLLLVGVSLLLVGFGFKVAAAPFHMWAPDVYEGAPTPITAYMAAAVKAAAFAAFFRLWLEAFPTLLAEWHQAVWWLAVITMVGGNLFALSQRSLKRMLAYSSVAHAGYLLVAVSAGGAAGSSAFLVYVIAYTLTSLGAFAVLTAKGRGGESDVLIDDLAGLATRRPWLAFALAVCMLSLLGFPGTAGFIGKWYILIAATTAGKNTLAAILVLTSVVSAGYYLPVIMAMYMKPEPNEAAHVDVCLDRWGRSAVAVVVVGLLLFGVWPNRLLELARSAVETVQPAATTAVTPR